MDSLLTQKDFMPFHLLSVTPSQVTMLRRIVTGALYLEMSSFPWITSELQFKSFVEETMKLLASHLTTGKAAFFNPWQQQLAAEVQELFNPTPVGYVTGGDISFTKEGELPINFRNVENEAQAHYWIDECFLRVHPVFVGPAVNKAKPIFSDDEDDDHECHEGEEDDDEEESDPL